jgi:hypothetical protein
VNVGEREWGEHEQGACELVFHGFPPLLVLKFYAGRSAPIASDQIRR